MLARSIVLALAGAGALLLAPTVTADGGADAEVVEPPKPTGTEVLRDRPYMGAGGPTLDAYLHPDAAAPRPGLVLLHGGAWMSGDKRSMARVAVAAARRGFAVFNVNYTLARPGRPGFPNQFAEIRAALRWIRMNADGLNVDPGRIGVLGSSAGGHLASLLATAGRGSLAAGVRVRAAVTWSGPSDLVELRGWLGLAVKNFVGCLAVNCPARERAASPLTHVSADDPAMLIFNSTREIVPARQARALGARLAAARVPRRVRLLRGAMHGREYVERALQPSLRFLVRSLTQR